MRKTLKNSEGITLVALVVTIIILIILAAISINILIGTDGLIAKTKQAKENMELATIEEQTRLNELYGQLDNGIAVAGTSFAEQTIGTATSDKILKDYTAYVNGQLVTGTIPTIENQNILYNAYSGGTSNRTAVTTTTALGDEINGDIDLAIGEQVTIPSGYLEDDVTVRSSSKQIMTLFLYSSRMTSSSAYSQNGYNEIRIPVSSVKKIEIRNISKSGSGSSGRILNGNTIIGDFSQNSSFQTITNFSAFTSGYVTIALYTMNTSNAGDYVQCYVDLYLK